MNPRLVATLTGAVGFTVAGVALAVTPAAHATGKIPGDPPPVCSTWKARGATGAYPNVVFGGKPFGTDISASGAKLTKPLQGVDPGVEFASYDINTGPLGGTGPSATSTVVKVKFTTMDGASTSSGAVRMFAYYATNANTLTTVPDHYELASGSAGQISFAVPAGKSIGTLGLVYDASNSSKGAILFKDLMIGEKKVRFTRCSVPTPTSTVTSAPVTPPTDKPITASPSVSPTVSASASSSAPVVPPTTPPAGAEPSLPVTGPGIGVIIGAGVAVIGTGLGLMFLVRRRKVSFES